MKNTELIEQLQNEIKHHTNIMEDRHRRIAEGLTDMDDCFLSNKMNALNIQLAMAKIKILENGGTREFDVLKDIETGDIVSKRYVDGRYGPCHLIEDEYVSKFGRFVGIAKREATYTKKGLKRDRAELPCWATIKANGSGVYGAYMSSVVIYKTEKNYAL